MAEQSHREEMNAAIRAQRERSAAPKTITPEAQAEPPQPEESRQPDPARRLFRRRRGTPPA
jgi:hypothetical protein